MKKLGRYLTAAAASSLASELGAQALDYPETAKVNVVDTFHGVNVADPYRWLERDVRTSPDVRAWVTAQNEVTFGYLEQLESRQRIRNRLRELIDYERFSSPSVVAGHYYYLHNSGLQNQSVLYRVAELDGEPELVIDPNAWSEDGTTALAGAVTSHNGRYMAYARSVAGSDWTEWFVRDLASGEDLDDHLEWTKFTSVSWAQDDTGFFYSRFDEPADGEEFQSLNTNQKVFYHRIGTPQSEDVLVHARPDEPTWGFDAIVGDDGRYLILLIWEGTDPRNRVHYIDLEADAQQGEPVALVDHFDYEFSFLGNDGARFYFKTDYRAPNGRVIAIDTARPAPEDYVEIFPESANALQSVSLIGDRFYASYLSDVTTEILVYSTGGDRIGGVPLPGKGSASGFRGDRDDTETFFTYTSFDTPPSLHHYDVRTGESRLWKQPRLDFDPAQYTVEQVFVESADGTPFPIFIAHGAGVERDGRRPVLLYGYGGFNVSLTPSFSALRLAWMEMGGVYVQANLRGGGEYGREWHEAGKLHNKQNVFDDFIAASEWLIENDYASPDTLAIEGSSNGGLLVGAAMVQRPDLFGAVLADVGVMDMLRFHLFTAGRYWVDDYGRVDDPDEFATLYAYSPYHNLAPAEYPPTLVTTADTDDRVVPGHSFKFAARLQEMQTGDAPVLIRIETDAGHGAGKPIEKVIEEVADQYAFLVEHIFRGDGSAP